jgi:hypothetical protein
MFPFALASCLHLQKISCPLTLAKATIRDGSSSILGLDKGVALQPFQETRTEQLDAVTEPERAAIQGPPGHIGLGLHWIFTRAYNVTCLNVVDEYISSCPDNDSSGRLMTRPSTASSNHTNGISSLHTTSNALLGANTGQFCKVA